MLKTRREVATDIEQKPGYDSNLTRPNVERVVGACLSGIALSCPPEMSSITKETGRCRRADTSLRPTEKLLLIGLPLTD